MFMNQSNVSDNRIIKCVWGCMEKLTQGYMQAKYYFARICFQILFEYVWGGFFLQYIYVIIKSM